MPLGYFYTRVKIGTPGQEFTVIVDTGSTLLAVPCKGCERPPPSLCADDGAGASASAAAAWVRATRRRFRVAETPRASARCHAQM